MICPLPDELAYLKEIATTVGPAWRYWAKEARVERHGRIWGKLAQAHQRLCQQEDGPEVVRWLSQTSEQGRAGDQQREVMGLMRLLRALGKAAVAPFAQPVLSLLPRSCRQLAAAGTCCSAEDENNLPAALLRRLKQARALGIRPHWQSLADFVDRVDEARFDRLCMMVHHMQRTGEVHQLRSLIIQKQIASRQAAAMARSLLHVVDALEIF